MSFLSRWQKKKPAPAPRAAVQARFLSYQCAAVQGIGAREHQEDAWTLVNASDVTQIKKLGLLAVVADGMGGMANGSLASSTGIRILTEDFQNMNRGLPLEKQLTGSVYHAADTIFEMLRGSGGSTVVACILYDEQLYYAGLGDSYLYLLRKGMLIRINREQNVLHQRYMDAIQSGDISTSASQNIVKPQAITGFLGAPDLKDVDQLSSAMPMEKDDVLLLCSDGVGGVLQPEEIQSCLGLNDANAAAAALKQAVLAKNRKYQDNFTAIVICCKK